MPRRGSLANTLTSAALRYEKRLDDHIHGAAGDELGAELVQLVREMTSTLLESGNSLVRLPSEELGAKLAIERLGRPEVPRRLLMHLELQVARSFTLATDEMAERCVELARLVVTNHPGSAVQRFLQRLGRCYVAGFFPETIIMCRAALENALNDKFGRERKPFPGAPEGRSPMRAKLRRAEELGWLTRQQSNEAFAVWERGSKAAHNDPEATKAVLATVESTMSLLRSLCA